MLDHSPKTLTCASCGAPLDYDGHSTFVQCKFCKTTSVMPGARENQAQLTPGLLAEIRTLAEGGNMLEAVRRFREATGVDLKTAKSSVEMLVSGRVMVASQVISGPLTAEQTGQILEQVQELLRADNKVEAIRRYREATDVSMVKSRDVVERVEAALKGLPPPQPLEIPGQLSPYQPASSARHRSWFGLILTLGIFLFVAGLLSLIFFLPGGPFNSMMISNGPAILAESGLGETSLAGVFYHVNDESYRVAMLDPTSGKIRWKADPLPGQGYASAMILVDELVIVASESDLLGFRVEDGSPAWHTILPDRLNYSDQAILAVSGRVITNTADQSIQAYEAAIRAAEEILPQAFDLLPRASVTVIGGEAGDFYMPPAYDGSRPGIFWARTSGQTPRFGVKTLAYHETVPGHHLQIAIAQEMPNQPALRQGVSFTGYTEGWALYAERLMMELGVYQDDIPGDLGRLQAEAFRAARLVVDTGIHTGEMNFNEAVDFLAEATGFTIQYAQQELTRYSVWPGQATAYYIGFLKILELRQRAMDALGAGFDLKTFHRLMVGNGAMPLEVLEEFVEEYIEGTA